MLLSLLALITVILFVCNSSIGTHEKPFIGASKAENFLSTAPIYFKNIPDGLIHNGTMLRLDNKMVAIACAGKNITDLSKFMPIFETIVKPDLSGYSNENIDGQTFYYLYKYGENGTHQKGLLSRKT